MKAFLALAAIFSSALVYADPACTALSNYVGNYKLVSSTCKGPFGDTLSVTPYAESTFSGFAITSGGLTIGPATSANACDKCDVSGGNVTVETSALCENSIPKDWLYSFSGPNVSFQANGCVAQFVRTN